MRLETIPPYETRLRSVQARGWALLLACVTHIVLTAAVVMDLMPIAFYLGATLILLPITCFVAQLYTLSVAAAREARGGV